MTPTLADVEQAVVAAEAEYDEVNRLERQAANLTTQERSVLFQRKVSAWHALQAARKRYLEFTRSAAG